MAKKVNVKITSNTKGDRMNIAVLFSLYLLQGIPLGLCAAIPMLLQNKKVSYRQQVWLLANGFTFGISALSERV